MEEILQFEEEFEEEPPKKKPKTPAKAPKTKAKVLLRRQAEVEPPEFSVEEIVDAVSTQVKRQLDAHDKAQRSVLNEASLAFEVESSRISV